MSHPTGDYYFIIQFLGFSMKTNMSEKHASASYSQIVSIENYIWVILD